MKNVILLIFAAFLLTSCLSTNQFQATSSKFKGKYTSFLTQGEQEVNSGYHYVTSRNYKGEYIIRTFFPETKQITSYVTYNNESTYIKNGLTIEWFDNGFMKNKGSYTYNEKSGFWIFYSFEDGIMDSAGNYTSGTKNGLWKYYNKDENVIEKINFKAGDREGEFVQYDSLGVIINEGIYKADTIFQQTNPLVFETNTPEFMPFLTLCSDIKDMKERQACSERLLLQAIIKNVKYPLLAREYGIQGRAVVQFIVEKDGSITNIKVRHGLCEGIKNECIKTIGQLPKWEGGMQNGKKIRVAYNLPFNFKLE